MRRGILPILCLLSAVVSSAAGQTDAWLEVRTPHFLVVSNAAEKDARLAAHKFEAMRAYGDGNNPEQYVTAYVWYVQAQRSGAEQADAKVAELESRMTPDQLAEAHKRVDSSATPK